MKEYMKIKRVELYNYAKNQDVDIEDPADFILLLTAIPFIGTILIIGYFICRRKKIIFREVSKK